MDRPTLASPCVGVCALDAAKTLCVGCGRTRDEIARWRDMDDAAKAATLAAAARRRIALAEQGN